ncbi:hypothetical protein D3C71_1928650 [compost metagenome]
MPGLATHDAHHIHALVIVAERHEVIQHHDARAGFKARFQHGGIGHVTARGLSDLAMRGNAPMPVALVAQQRRKACRRIEMRQA